MNPAFGPMTHGTGESARTVSTFAPAAARTEDAAARAPVLAADASGWLRNAVVGDKRGIVLGNVHRATH